MTTAELHKILDDKGRRLTLNELKNVLYELTKDCNSFKYKVETKPFKDIKSEYFNKGYYAGESNAFYICLDLLEHVEEQYNEFQNR